MNLAIETIKLLAILLAPFALFAIVIHLLERLIQTRLAERFGWNSVLCTGWLGTPIHELSHALMCRVFHHKIDEIALFEPCLLYTSPSPRDATLSRMPSSA